jgi:ArsR family transcriptional regulator, arsenate/arsenite/antimonite-responsive transcriptional repressor
LHPNIDGRQYVRDVGSEDEGTAMTVRELPVLEQPEVEACCAPLAAVLLTEPEAQTLARQFAALADPVRLRLLSIVASQDEVCSCELEEPLGKSQPTVSHHTKALAEAGLIVGEKRGKWMWWRVVPERLDALRAALR